LREKISNILVLLLLFLLSIFFDVDDKSEPVEIYKPKSKLDKEYDLRVPKEGKAQNLANMKYAKIQPLHTLGEDIRNGYSISSRDTPEYAGVKPSTHNKMYFVNGYLNGFVPHNVDNIWTILGYVQTRLKYQLDEKGYSDRAEVWQTSKESYIRLRGDCEDHAILLADWLIGLGYDARVVSGTVNIRGETGGHAWVILYTNGKEYLLEATQKSKWNQLPLASKFPNYFPKYMFNRKNFWINVGSKLTTKYSGKQWKKSGKFVPYNPYYKD